MFSMMASVYPSTWHNIPGNWSILSEVLLIKLGCICTVSSFSWLKKEKMMLGLANLKTEERPSCMSDEHKSWGSGHKFIRHRV